HEFLGAMKSLCTLVSAEDGIVWLTLLFNGERMDSVQQQTIEKFRRLGISDRSVQSVWSGLTGATGGGIQQHWLPETLNHLLAKQLPKFPDVKLIPAK